VGGVLWTATLSVNGQRESPRDHFVNTIAYLEGATLLGLWFGVACCAGQMRAKQASRYESGSKLRHSKWA